MIWEKSKTGGHLRSKNREEIYYRKSIDKIENNYQAKFPYEQHDFGKI